MDASTIIGFILIIAGIAGVFLPLLPGPLLSLAGMLVLHFGGVYTFSLPIIIVAVLLTIMSVASEYFFPVWTTKKFGGSNYGIWGATLGLLIGPFVLPFLGFVLGPALGAFIGEMIKNSNNTSIAVKASLGTLVGFFMGIGMKLLVCMVILVMAIISVFNSSGHF